MTGPEHYREAERLLAGKHFTIEGEPFHNPPSDRDIARAQVHATLAQAAAAALIDETPRSDSFAAYRAWESVAGGGAESSAELAGVRERVRRIHRSVDSSFDDDGSCIACGDDYPCPTLRALDGVEAGDAR